MGGMAAVLTKPKRKRRWLRFSLRTMLVVVLVSSVWLGYQANRAARQREAVKALRVRGVVAAHSNLNLRTPRTRRVDADIPNRY